jgi:hypothetical protein
MKVWLRNLWELFDCEYLWLDQSPCTPDSPGCKGFAAADDYCRLMAEHIRSCLDLLFHNFSLSGLPVVRANFACVVRRHPLPCLGVGETGPDHLTCHLGIAGES